MTYAEAINETVSRQQAILELKRHSADEQEFFADVGDKIEYTGKEVLDWLGY